MREVFRGVVVECWVALPLEKINCRVHNKIIVREAVEFYSKCWRERCEALHTPEHENTSLNNDTTQKKEDAAKGRKVNYEIHVNVHPINEKIASIDAMRSWMNKARLFRENAKDATQQDIMKFGVMR